MTIEQIKEMVAGSEYDFRRTNPHLKDRIIFLTLGGSYSYGTNVASVDDSGKVTGRRRGVTRIYAKVRGLRLSCKVTVLGIN